MKNVLWLLVAALLCFGGCTGATNRDDTDGDADSDSDSDTDTDADTDGDSDADGDADGDGDADADGDGDADSDSNVDADADTDADSDGDPSECTGDEECVLACNGTCCTCPQVVHVDETADPVWYLPVDGDCLTDCGIPCEACPPTPEPACVDGQCAPLEGCTEDADCAVAFECVCDCEIAVSIGQIATDDCIVPLELGREGCGGCMIDSDCGGCRPAPSASICLEGRCEPVYDPDDWLLAPCNDPHTDCPEGFTCFPGSDGCGFGARGVCYPEDRHFCDGLEGLPCPHDGTTCLSQSECCDQFGLCLHPDEIERVCAELPGCFLCDIDSGSGSGD